MTLLVMKFGGKAVESPERIRESANIIASAQRRGNKVIAVVSAMAGETDRLLGLCNKTASAMPACEMDTVVSVGEQITSGLMAGRLSELGIKARSVQGWQMSIMTDAAFKDARIIDINQEKVREARKALESGEVLVVSGFQGVTVDGRITTLGRGGSDTTAVALARVFGADACVFYKDEPGVLSADPKVIPRAQLIEEISYEEMLEMSGQGAKVLNPVAVILASPSRKKNGKLAERGVPLWIRSFNGIENQNEDSGTLVVDGLPESGKPVIGIVMSAGHMLVTVEDVPDRPGSAAEIFGALGDKRIAVDMISQPWPDKNTKAVITFAMPEAQLADVHTAFRAAEKEIGRFSAYAETNIGKVILVGKGMDQVRGVAFRAFETIGKLGVNIRAIHTSDISLGLAVPRDHMENTARALHSAFGLDAPEKTRRICINYQEGKAEECKNLLKEPVRASILGSDGGELRRPSP